MKRSLLVSLFFLLALPAIAQQAKPAAAVPDTYGTASLTYLPLDVWSFVPIDSNLTYEWNGNPWGIYRTNPTPPTSTSFHAGLQLPEGAQVQYLELNVCDTTTTGNFGAWILSTNHTGVSATLANFANLTTVAETPGCVVRGLTLPTPFTVDNVSFVYLLEVDLSEAGTGLVLIGARLGYKLQVSPPPGTATFSDVPTSHPFFQYVEALAASGITAGCGNGQYCPDVALTRGQMAVFLARALGLQWAP